MIEFVKKNLLQVIITVAGALGGFLYWKFIGCVSGSCPIKSVWYMSTLFGALLGFLTGSIINDIILKIRKKK
jgi:hypothetical protein